MLKHLRNFCRTLHITLINCKKSLTLTWFENCAITRKATRTADANNNLPAINAPKNATMKIKDLILYVTVVTLSTKDDNKLLEQLKLGFKRTIKWNKYRSEISNQTEANSFKYLIDPTFNKVNRLFVPPFENENDRISFSNYYVISVEIKKIFERSKHNDYTTGNLLNYEYFSKNYKH